MCRESSCTAAAASLGSAASPSGSPSCWTGGGSSDLECRTGGGSSDLECEEVPELLEEMNHAAAEVNLLEQASAGAVDAYQARLVQWNEVHQQLRSSYGARAFDRASRLLRAEEAFEASWKAVEQATAAFSLAAEGPCQGTRQACEGECVQTLAVFQAAKSHFGMRQAKLGEKATRLLPQLRQLLQQRAELALEQDRLGELGLRTRASKVRYGSSMAQLERISEAIHHRRRQQRVLSASSTCSTFSPSGSEEVSPESEAGGELSEETSM